MLIRNKQGKLIYINIYEFNNDEEFYVSLIRELFN